MENIPEIILSVKTGIVDPITVTPDFTGQLYLNTVTDVLFFAKSLTIGDYQKIIDAENVPTDTTNFDGILSSADDTVQKALDTIDNVSSIIANRSIIFRPDQSHNFGDYRVHNISAAGNSNLSFKIPEEFVSFISLVVHFIPTNTIAGGQDIDLNSDYAQAGEIFNTHSESNLAIPITGTANVIESFDISSVFSAISAGDICGFNWKNNTIGTTISIVEIELRYSAI